MNTTLGNKRICQDCGAKFYDMGRMTLPCPKCGTIQEDKSLYGSGSSLTTFSSAVEMKQVTSLTDEELTKITDREVSADEFDDEDNEQEEVDLERYEASMDELEDGDESSRESDHYSEDNGFIVGDSEEIFETEA